MLKIPVVESISISGIPSSILAAGVWLVIWKDKPLCAFTKAPLTAVKVIKLISVALGVKSDVGQLVKVGLIFFNLPVCVTTVFILSSTATSKLVTLKLNVNESWVEELGP